MRSRPLILILLGLLVLAGVWFFWPAGPRPSARKNNNAKPAVIAPSFTSSKSASTAPVLFATNKTATNAPTATKTNRFAWRLTNTPKKIGELTKDPHAILLANAFIDTGASLNLAIPKHLQSQGDPGAYIVQARGPVDAAFRAALAAAGAQIVSYIPNNAYLVRITSGGATALGGQPPVQSVIPYEPYYKISGELIGPAVQQQALPSDAVLTLGLFADDATTTIDQIKNLGGTVVGTDRSPFGPILRVIPSANWTMLATLPGVQIVELGHHRASANDLARVTMGISTDTVTNANYMGLSGHNVTVEVNDTGVDANHPDFSANGTAATGPSGPTRVIAVTPASKFDTNGHGTHVAGILAGNGSKSYSIPNTPQGSVTNADFRGKAPLATLYSFAALDTTGNLDIPDSDLQEVPATNHALISNNSWTYGDSTYDLAAASYDAAVRDALPLLTGSQPVLFVFAAGNDGGGSDDGGGGTPDSILSPGTAKDVITVGALEQLRSITNSVTNLDGTVTTPWEDGTSSDNEVAGTSARGNVGIGTEGDFGRFKPDVVAPGSFVVSTRSAQWDTNAYYNPTNITFNEFDGQVVDPNTLNYYPVTVPANAVTVSIFIVPNATSSSPFPSNLPIYVAKTGFPTTTANDGVTFKNEFDIPADADPGFLQAVQNGAFNFAVGNNSSHPVNYDIIVAITTTNDLGNYFQVLEGLNETLAPYYRYESGTSMATPAVSGLLALMQDYFTNDLHATTPPSPALLKAMVINGARSQGSYDFAVTNTPNLQGWGLPDLTNSLPFGLTHSYSAPCASFFLDQSPTNALATGASQTFIVNLETTDFAAQAQPLRVTLAWTDPPGNPAAAIKLVNSLELVVTNLDATDPNYGSVYFGNNFDPGNPSFSGPWDTNTVPNIDFVNNVQNVFLPASSSPVGLIYSVTVIGRSVNVNAVTAQTNNVVQDFALVISSGDGGVTNAIMVAPPAPNPFIGPQVTFVSNGNSLLTNQFAGGNTPLLGTNTVGAGAGYITNAAITLGMTNQWHFYVVTNTFGFTNAAFITFLSQTLATPRMGVFADQTQNPTQPEADIDLYVASVSTDPNAFALTNLDPVVISNCVNGVNGDAAALGNGTGTEFVAYTNSVPSGVYIIGVKSETQEAAEYDFLPVFSQQPFSQMNPDGSETVNGLLLPVNITDGTPAHPGDNYVIALAIQPIQVQDVIVTNTFFSQNFGDLVGLFSHGGKSVVLNNHNSPLPTFPPDGYDFIYDTSPTPIPGSQPPDGPGSLNDFQGQQAVGPWILTEVDNSHTQTSSVTSLQLLIRPHLPLGNPGVTVSIAPQSWFYGFIDVPAGATNLTVAATNVLSVPGSPPLQLYVKLGEIPTLTNFDKTEGMTNGVPPGGSVSIGPSDLPPIQPGRYFVGIYNGSATFYNNVFVIAKIALGQVAPLDFGASGPTNLLDDAVTYSSVFVTNTLPIATIGVGLRVDHPRISDLVFHLISPDGTRYLLMENRGGTSTNGAGMTVYTTNIVNVASSGGSGANTNYVNVGENTGTLTINYNFYAAPDQMTVYASTNASDFSSGSPTLLLNTGLISGSSQLNIPFTTPSGYLTIIMNEFGNPDPNTLWTYSAGGVQTNYYYLVLTQDTNLTTTPIKFAPPPFVPAGFYSTNFGFSDFESATPGDYMGPITGSSWSVIGNQASVVNDPATAYQGSRFVALANGVISNNIPTVPGGRYTLNYAYRGPGIVSWWRGENNASDSIGGNNGVLTSGGTYGPGEVGSAFILNGSGGHVQVPANPSLNVGSGTGFTIETWINPSNLNPEAIAEWNDNAGNIGAHLFISESSAGSGPAGCLYANLYNGANHIISTGGGIVTVNNYQHVALTYDKTSGIAVLYRNGVPVQTSNLGTISPTTSYDFYLGTRPSGFFAPSYFTGALDEASLYQRALSQSEIKAIYTAGTNGKFNSNQFNDSPAQSLSEASVSIPGVTPTLIFGDNTNWQQQTISFTATSTSTPVVITGLEPGVLLDSFSVAGSSGGSLYYLPEQSLDPLVGTSPFGLWQLEIQDDRAGATNHTVLDSWQLQLVFANTNQVPENAGSGVTNSVPPGETFWIEVDVPTNADFATNILTFATGPLNMWYSTNVPPTTTNPPGDVQLLFGATSGSRLLDTNGYPNIVPGGTYFIGLQNPGSVTVDFGFRVDFHLNLPNITNCFAFTQPATSVTGTSAQLNGMATPNGLPATAWFEWGTNTLYGNQTALIPVGAGFNVVYTSAPIAGLVTNVPYHFRLVVSNATTVVYGFDQILDEANVVAWGADYVGQASVPATLSNNMVAVAGAYDHSLALKNDGTAAAWGDNNFGQSTVPAGLNNLVALAGGLYYSMALKNNGTVVAWGANILGQTNVPAGLNGVINIAGGTYSSLALKSDGSVVAWGANFFNLTNVPANATNVVAIAGGEYHSLALLNNGTVIAWGDNSANQTNVPAGLTNVVGIAGGSYHSLALRSDGTVVAWGDDGAFQTNVPASLNNVVAIAAGGFHSMALKADGTVVTWGDNTAGQSSVPVGLTNVVAISAGYLHSLALTPQSIASLTNIILDLVDGVPQTNTISPGGVTYYKVSVPTNADFATNLLLYTINGPLNVWFSTNSPPTVGAGNDSLLLSAVTNGTALITTNGLPLLVPGATYYLGVQNLNATPVNYGVEVDFHLVTTNPPQTVPIYSIIYTNIGGTNGFLLTWFAPSNDLFQVQWSPGLAPPTWTTFTNPPVVSYNPAFPAGPANAQFNFFDDGSQTGGFGPTRFYRLILLGSPSANTPPVLPVQTTQTVNPLSLLIVTNTATDAQSPPQILTYALSSTVTGTNKPAINPANGIITWTPDLSQAGTSNLITTVVTDNGTPPLSATNSFSVIVNPVPGFSSITKTNGGFLLTWFAPSNDLFHVQWSPGLAPPTWTTFTNPPVISYNTNFPAGPTNAQFNFFDDGSQTGGFGPTRFYRMILLAFGAPNVVTLPAQTNFTASVSALVTVTNTATDSNANAILTYSLLIAPPNASIQTNGIITWTNAVPAGLAARFTTMVTDNGVPPASATNSFTIFVAPFPAITNVTVTATNALLRWSAPANDLFQVQWTTNLAPVINWTTFPDILNSATGIFAFTDTNAPFVVKFYRLLLLP